jgi:hypothetical protein
LITITRLIAIAGMIAVTGLIAIARFGGIHGCIDEHGLIGLQDNVFRLTSDTEQDRRRGKDDCIDFAHDNSLSCMRAGQAIAQSQAGVERRRQMKLVLCDDAWLSKAILTDAGLT